MGDYEQLERQLRQTREHVDRLSLSEKNKLRPIPVERTFNWSLFASAVGAVSFILIIGLFARILANPPGEVATAVTSTVEVAATPAVAISEAEARIRAETLAQQEREGRTGFGSDIVSSALLPRESVLAIVGNDVAMQSQWAWVVEMRGFWQVNGVAVERCAFFIDADTGDLLQTRCPYPIIDALEGLSRDEAMQMAVEIFGAGILIGDVTLDSVSSAELNPLTGAAWVVTLQGDWELDAPPTPSAGSAEIPTVNACVVEIDIATGNSHGVRCHLVETFSADFRRDDAIQAATAYLTQIENRLITMVDVESLNPRNDSEPGQTSYIPWQVNVYLSDTETAECDVNINSFTGSQWGRVTCKVDGVVIGNDLARLEAIEAAIAFAKTSELMGEVVQDNVISAELIPPDPDDANFWEITLLGSWEIAGMGTRPNGETASPTTVNVCVVLVDAETREGYHLACEPDESPFEPQDELVSASKLLILPRQGGEAEQYARLNSIRLPSPIEDERKLVKLSFDYALTTAVEGLLVVHWGYYLDAETYNTGNLVAPITTGGGFATVTFEVDPRLVHDLEQRVFEVEVTLRTPAADDSGLLYFVPADETQVEPALRPETLRELGANFLVAHDWATVEERLANGLFDGLIVHHAAAADVDQPTLRHYHNEEGVLLAGLGVDVEWLIGETGDFNAEYATPLFYTYSRQTTHDGGTNRSYGDDSLIAFGGTAQFLTIVESLVAEPTDMSDIYSRVGIGTLAEFPASRSPYYLEIVDTYLVNIDGDVRVLSTSGTSGDWLEGCSIEWNPAVDRFVDLCSGFEWNLDGTLHLGNSDRIGLAGDLNQHPYVIENEMIVVNLNHIIPGHVASMEAVFGTEANPQTDIVAIRRILQMLAQRNRDSFLVDGWTFLESEHFASDGGGLEKERERQQWVQLNVDRQLNQLIWRNLLGSHLFGEGVYRPNQPNSDAGDGENLAAITSILWDTETLLHDAASIVAFTTQGEDGRGRYVVVRAFLTSVQRYEFDYESGRILQIENHDDIGQFDRTVFGSPRYMTTLPANASLLLSLHSSTSSSDEASSVMLDLYSGRPNPEWTLDPEPSQELFDTLDIAIRTAGHSRFENLGLGYRGVVVRRGDVTLRFLDGRVQMEQPGLSAVFFRDDDFALRDRVLATGEISADVRAAICSAEPSATLCDSSP